MFRKYQYAVPERRESFILTSDGNAYNAIARPSAGNSADTRFFGKEGVIKYVVKRPKFRDQFGMFDEVKMQAIERGQLDAYRKEQQVWNLFYPHNKADLFTEGGLRLVMPYLPGKRLTSCNSRDVLTCCQQLLSVAYAVQKFHQLGFKYGDFNTDNVLVEQRKDGSFQAYLIDFNATLHVHEYGGSQELNALNILYPSASWGTHYGSLGDLIDALKERIELLSAKEVLSNNASVDSDEDAGKRLKY